MGMNILRCVGTFHGGVKDTIDLIDTVLLGTEAVDSVHLAFLSPDGKVPEDGCLQRRHHPIQVSNFESRTRRNLSPGSLINTYKTIDGVMGDFPIDVVHIHSPQLPVGTISAVAAARRNIPIVLTYHGGKREGLLDNFGMKFFSFLPKRFAQRKIAISKEAQYLMGADAEIVRVPVDGSIFSPGDDDYFSLRGPVVFYPAKIYPKKGQLDLVEAARKLGHQNYTIVITGAAKNQDYMQEIRRRILRYELSDTVHVMDEIPHSEMASAFRSAYLQPFPTYEEGLGRIVVEAGMCRVPTVAYRTGGVPEIIREGDTGFLVQKGDVRSLTDRMAQLLNDSRKRDEMGIRASEEFLKGFEPAVIAGRYLESYVDVLDRAA